MAAELIDTADHVDVPQNGWPTVGPRLGLVENVIDVDTNYAYTEAGDWMDVFVFGARTIVLAAGIEVITGSTGACNITLGTGGDSSILTTTSVATANTVAVNTATVPIAFAAAAKLTAAFSADPAGLHIRIWALVMDASSLKTGADL